MRHNQFVLLMNLNAQVYFIFSLDYLGTITARHRKDLHHTVSDDVRLDMVVKVLVYDELDESEQTGDVNAVDISHVRRFIFFFLCYMKCKLPLCFGFDWLYFAVRADVC